MVEAQVDAVAAVGPFPAEFNVSVGHQLEIGVAAHYVGLQHPVLQGGGSDDIVVVVALEIELVDLERYDGGGESLFGGGESQVGLAGEGAEGFVAKDAAQLEGFCGQLAVGAEAAQQPQVCVEAGFAQRAGREAALGFQVGEASFYLGCQGDGLPRCVFGDRGFLETGLQAGQDCGQVVGAGGSVEDFSLDAGVRQVGQAAQAELHVEAGLLRGGFHVQAVRLEVADASPDLAVQPQGEAGQFLVQDRFEGLHVETGVVQRGVDMHLVEEVGKCRKAVKSQAYIPPDVGASVAGLQAADLDAGGVQRNGGAERFQVQVPAVGAQGQLVDPGGGGPIVADVAHAQVDVLQLQAVQREIDMLQVQPAGLDVVPGQAAGRLVLLRFFLQRGEQRRQVGGAVVDVPDGDETVFDSDPADARFLGEDQGGGLHAHEYLAQMRQCVTSSLDDIDILQDQVVGEGQHDFSHPDVPVQLLRQDVRDLSHQRGLHGRDLHGDHGSCRDDEQQDHQDADDFLPGLHGDVKLQI